MLLRGGLSSGQLSQFSLTSVHATRSFLGMANLCVGKPNSSRLIQGSIHATFGLHARCRSIDMRKSPFRYGGNDRAQRLASGGQAVGISAEMFGGRESFNDASLKQSTQSICQNVGRDAFRRLGELFEMRASKHQVSYHQKRPLIAQDIERTSDWAW